MQRAGLKKPRVGTVEELKVSFVHYSKENDPQQLECKVERFLLERGHKILWTPPYCPELQPIELFWAAGKNHVAAKFETNQTMRNVVKYLREGWYGNGDAYAPDHPYHKSPVDCRKLWATCKKIAWTKFVPLCDGISGIIGDLKIDDTFKYESVMLPIDTLVVDLTKHVEDDDTMFAEENI